MIGVSGVCLAVCLLIALKAVFFGTRGITVSIGRRIESPALWQVLLVCGIVAAAAAVPFFALTSRRARRQFADGLRPEGGPDDGTDPRQAQ